MFCFGTLTFVVTDGEMSAFNDDVDEHFEKVFELNISLWTTENF